jgi:AcrR family transcriptional regulator
MAKSRRSPQRRKEALSRESIIGASIELLDSTGEAGLTFSALSEHLATGAGAIYWHIANRNDLLVAACDAIIARTMGEHVVRATPRETIRELATRMFDAMDAHPWVGAVLVRVAGQLPMVRIFERIGQQVRALGVPGDKQWVAVSAILNYILGVGGQNAANAQFASVQGLDRAKFLDEVSTAWSQLAPDQYPFARSVAGHMRTHDDRVDFIAGIDLILNGIRS